MVHPSQRSAFSGRRPPTVVSIARHGKVRSFRIRPWAAALALTGFAAFSTAYFAATGYLVYRDDLLGAALSRQVAMQYAYEDRIAALRSEIDRVTSRHAVATQDVGEQLAILLGRQAVIDRHRQDLAALVDRARETGVELPAELARLPAARPAADERAPGEANTLAYAAPDLPTENIITGALIRGPEASGTVKLRPDLKPILTKVQSALDDAESRQTQALDRLGAATGRTAARLSAALAPVGSVADEPVEAGPRGGPFIAAGGLHFVERTTLLGRRLENIAALRRIAEGLPLRPPIVAAVSSRFGTRLDPFLNRPALHSGMDFVAEAGMEVRATGDGVVVSAGPNGSYGQMVEVRHAGGVETRYAHLSAVLVEPGASVAAGAPIGRVGSTGRSTGPHLHYETRRGGEAVDPAPYLAAGRAF